MPEILGLITARGGSRGIPRKNIKLLAGKPLISWTIEASLSSRWLSRVVVSTDDDEIAEVSRRWGAELPFRRPEDLARDTSPHIDTIVHALGWLEENQDYRPELVMLLQPTCPLRTAEDIDRAVELAITRQAAAVISVSEASPHPYLAKRISTDGTLRDLIESDIEYLRRQALPEAYVVNGAIYLHRRESLLEHRQTAPDGSLPYVMPPSRSLDIDSLWDFSLAELILGGRNARQVA